MRQTINTLRFAVVFVGVVWLCLSYSAHHDAILAAKSDCVAQTAKEQGYSGNVHGPEAWALFASSCK